MTLASIALHNVWIDVHDETPKNWDINYDSHLQRRPRQNVAQLLMLAGCHPKMDVLCRKLFIETIS